MSGGGAAPAVEERALSVGEFKVNVTTAGAGPAIVMLHGEGNAQGWKQWQGLAGLAQSYRLIVPDMVGFGKSSRPDEVPGYEEQAKVVHELLDILKVDRATIAGYSWGGQVGLEVAIDWPERVQNLILVASTYDKGQLPRLPKVRRPTLVVWAEDDLVTQLKGGYLLRDAIETSRLEVLAPVAKDPKHDFTYAHRLLDSRRDELLALFRSFLASPDSATSEPPHIEKELRGMALKHETPDNWGKSG
jgi:dienelactone hydrolase